MKWVSRLFHQSPVVCEEISGVLQGLLSLGDGTPVGGDSGSRLIRMQCSHQATIHVLQRALSLTWADGDVAGRSTPRRFASSRRDTHSDSDGGDDGGGDGGSEDDSDSLCDER
ncbi:hypothetical protein E4U21_001491 [Claviceps maximensis]|nr:hypothetical protein E4U21_001491 [Claviceps maximensis]